MLRLIAVSLLFLTVNGAPSNVKKRPILDGRIVGGTPANIVDYPYQISILWGPWSFCAGAILNEETILTSASCVEGPKEQDIQLTVRYGATYHEQGGTVVMVYDIIIHPDYDYVTYDYDSALLKIANLIDFTPDTQGPIALASVDPNPGIMATMAGWGLEFDGEVDPPIQLMAVELPIIDWQSCNASYTGEDMIINDRMICAGLPEGGVDFCHGDNGGPLVVNGKVVGIASRKIGCAEPGFPGVYGSVASMRDFIEANL